MQPRCRPRVPVRYAASIQNDTAAGSATLFDLSSAGCRLHSNLALQPGSYLSLQIDVAEAQIPLAVEVSIVRWCRDGQVGVEFLRYGRGDRERVTELVEALPLHEVSVQPEYAEPTLTAACA